MWQINTLTSGGDAIYLRPHSRINGKWAALGKIDITEAVGYTSSSIIGKTVHIKIEVIDGKQVKTYFNGNEVSPFTIPDTVTALKMVGSVFTTFNYADFAAQIGTLGLTLGDWIVLAVAAAMLWAYDLRQTDFRAWYAQRCPAAKTALVCALGLLVLVFGVYGIGFNADAFIYSRF